MSMLDFWKHRTCWPFGLSHSWTESSIQKCLTKTRLDFKTDMWELMCSYLMGTVIYLVIVSVVGHTCLVVHRIVVVSVQLQRHVVFHTSVPGSQMAIS